MKEYLLEDYKSFCINIGKLDERVKNGLIQDNDELIEEIEYRHSVLGNFHDSFYQINKNYKELSYDELIELSLKYDKIIDDLFKRELLK